MSSSDTAPRHSRLRTWAWAGSAVLVGLYALYLAAGNLLLASEGFHRWLNRRPERLAVEWSAATTSWPGRVQVRDLGVRGRQGRSEWSAEIDRATLQVGLLPLLVRSFHLRSCDGEGVTFLLRHHPEAGEPAAAAGLPPPTRRTTPRPAAEPQAREGGEPSAGRHHPWKLRLDDVRLDRVREIRIDRYQLSGEGRVGGSFEQIPRGPLSAEGVELDWGSGLLRGGTEELARDLTVVARLDLAPLVPREQRGRRALAFLSGELEVEGQVAGLGFLSEHWSQAPGLTLDGGGAVAARLLLDRGALLPGSRLAVEGGGVTAHLLDLDLEGRGNVEGRVEERGGTTVSRLTIQVEEAALSPTAEPAAKVSAQGLSITATAVSPSLAVAASETTVAVDLPELAIPDLAGWSELLPPGLGLTFRGGSGRLRAHLEASPSAARIELDLVAEHLDGAWSGRRATGGLEAKLRLGSDVPGRRRFDLAGTRLRFDPLAFTGDPGGGHGGWAELTVSAGALELPASSEEGDRRPAGLWEGLPRADGHLSLEGGVSDLTLLGDSLPLPGWLATTGTVRMRSELHLAGGDLAPGTTVELAAPRLSATLGDFEITGQGTLSAELGTRGDEAAVAAAFQGFHLRLRGDSEPLLAGSDLKIRASGLPRRGRPGPRAGKASTLDLLDGTRVELELPRLTAVDAAGLNQLLPERLGFAFEAGTARLRGRFELASRSLEGHLEVLGQGLAATIRERGVAGDLRLTLALHHGDLDRGRFDLAGTRVELDHWRRSEPGAPGELSFTLTVESGRLEWIETAEGRGRLRFPDQSLKLRGEITDAGLLDDFAPVGRWLHLAGESRLSSEMRFQEGRLRPGSSVELVAERLEAGFLDYLAHGRGTVTGRLLTTGSKPETEVAVSLRQVEIRRTGETVPYLRSPSLTLEARGTDLSGTDHLAGLEVRARLERGEIPDLRTLNVYLPSASGLIFTSGQGHLEGEVELSGGRGAGRFALSAHEVAARVARSPILTDLRLDVALASDDPAGGRFDISGSRLRLTRTSVLGRPPDTWWATVTLPRATADLGRPLTVRGDLELAMRDTRPLVALLGEEKRALRWLEGVLTIQDITGTAQMQATADGLRLDPLEVFGEHLELKARLRLTEPREEGIFYISFHNLSAGVEVAGGRRRLKLLGARKWFDEHPGLPGWSNDLGEGRR